MFRTTQLVSMVMAVAVTIAPCMMSASTVEYSVKKHVVEITDLEFVPNTIHVRPGDMITWVNRDIVPHTATSVDGSWDTGVINQDESKSVVVSLNMTSAYLCRFHVNMSATVVLADRVE